MTKADGERLYIGGLDPPRLTAQQVLDRFGQLNKTGCQVEIRSVESHPDKNYCHATAVLQSSPTKTITSAFEVLHATYNNVKWKGCRLVVQAARPHFLERLEQERRERQQTAATENATNDVDATFDENHDNVKETATNISSQKIVPRRRLRIRKKFGDEAYHVDTKPWSVDNWSGFMRAVGKQRLRVEKYRQEKRLRDTSVAPTPLMHRAVHIRFDEPVALNGNRDIGADSDLEGLDQDDGVSPGLAGTTDDDSSMAEYSQDSADTVDSDKEASKKQKASYTWSGEEEEESSSNDEDENSIQSPLSKEIEPNEAPISTLSHEEEESNRVVLSEENEEMELVTVSSAQKTEGITKVTEPISTKEKMFTRKQTYQWSSDEESSTDGDGHGDGDEQPRSKIGDRAALVPATHSDEFADGLDHEHEDDDHVGGSDSDTGGNHVSMKYTIEEKAADLSNDVTANLDILSSLFPEVGEAQPAIMQSVDGQSSSKEEAERDAGAQSGFAASGIMLRFDPNDASTQKFEISTQNNHGDLNGSKQEHNEASDTSVKKGDEDGATTASNKETTSKDMIKEEPVPVYEQQKLDDVFREARNSWKEIQITDKGATSNIPGGRSGFSFGFDLGQEEKPIHKKNPAPTGFGFTFGFDLPKTENMVIDSLKEIERPISLAQSPVTEVATGKDTTASSEMEEERIRGFVFPDDLLAQYKKKFFAANNGEEIMKDPKSFENDPDVKEAWKKERHALTLDWKRKRKLAQSRIQKRMKIR